MNPKGIFRTSILSFALFVGLSVAHGTCPTASTKFQAYQADINGDGLPDVLFVPVPTMIFAPLGDDDDLVPLVVDPGLPAFNYLSSSASATVGGVPSNAVPVNYASAVLSGDAGSCGVLILRGQGAGLPTLIVSFSPTAGTAPTLVQTLASPASASNKISYSYDARDRLSTTSFGDGSPGITRGYTADGLLASVAAGGSNGSTWSYSYNNRRLLTQESLLLNGQRSNFNRNYDANAHLAQLGYPDGTVSYAPDALGQPTAVSGFASAVTWAPNGSLAGFTYANGIVHTVTQNTRGLPQQATDGGVVKDSYGYDEEANLVALSDGTPGGVASRTMAYDGLNRLTIANSPGVWGAALYAYDPLDNLRTSNVGTRGITHVYDGGNRLSQLVTNGSATGYGYDPQGNITTKGAIGFLFDIGNRLIASSSASYAYDGLGRRTVQNGTDGHQRVQMYSQDGQLLYGIFKPAGGVATSVRYVYLGGKIIAEVDASAQGGVRFLHTDGLGSPIARTTSAGALIDQTRYEPYGATAGGTNPGTGADNVGFTGHANDPDTGLVYMQQRYYDPIAGRFQSDDPITTDTETGNSFNRYEYAQSNPYRYTDPDGRAPAPIEIEEGGGGAGSAEALFARGMDGGPQRMSIAETRATLSQMRVEEGAKKSAKGLEGANSGVVEKTPSGKRVGDFTKSQKNAAKAESARANGGDVTCADCGKKVENIKSEKGISTPDNQAQVHHDPAIKDGGGQDSKAVVVCPTCHLQRHANE